MTAKKGPEDPAPKRKRAEPAKKAAEPRLRTKLTPAIRAEFCDLVREGAPFDLACDYVGIDSRTYYRWLRQGEEWIDGGGKPKALEPFGLFVVEAKRAFAEYRLNRTRSMHKAPPGAWQKDMTILERRDRKNYGKSEQQGGDDSSYSPNDCFL